MTIHQISLQLVSSGVIGTLNQIDQFENIPYVKMLDTD